MLWENLNNYEVGQTANSLLISSLVFCLEETTENINLFPSYNGYLINKVKITSSIEWNIENIIIKSNLYPIIRKSE